MVLTEKSSGTNAVSLSMYLGKAVYTFPNHHYCEFLRKLHLYSIPLSVNGCTIGYLALVSLEQSVSKELIVITDLLSYQVVNEFRIRSNRSAMHVDSKVKLSNKQVDVIKLIAAGRTDKAIAIETQLSLETIKYHKKNIFKKLKVNCNVEAVVKALKLNLISLE